LAGYDLWSTAYDETPNPLLQLEERELAPLLPPWRDRVAVDLGCGTGRWLAKLADSGSRFAVGVDFSMAMLKQARTKLGSDACFLNGDLARLPFRDGFAGLLICSFVLSHFEHLDSVASEMARIVPPRADLFVSDVHPEARENGWRTAFSLEGGTIEIRSFSTSTAEIVATFEKAGFDLVDLLEPRFGAAEELMLASAGRGHVIKPSRGFPAVLILHFRRAQRTEV
jgi:ubiquinone/menaquinone biosynthesis C-methylase UbiE